MPLILTGAVQYSVLHTDSGGTESRITLRQGDDAEAFGLSADELEKLASVKRSEQPLIYFFTNPENSPNFKVRAKVAPSEREANTSGSTISMHDMRRSLAENNLSTRTHELQLNEAAMKAHAEREASGIELPKLEGELPPAAQAQIDRDKAQAQAVKDAQEKTQNLTERLVEKVENTVSEVKDVIEDKVAKEPAKRGPKPKAKINKASKTN